jgi:uncharacterized surface protein with fasciclin (FAS1) repeats
MLIVCDMINFKHGIPYSFFLLIFFFFGCLDEMEKNKYERPEWLAGKLYSQILEQPELSVFARCIHLTGYDTIINTSGSYTVFAPTNQAIDSWLAQNPSYSSVDNIPHSELTRLVKYHIVQNPWTKKQLRSTDLFGWTDTLDISNDKPRGFKRETLLQEPNRKFGWKKLWDGRIIVEDTLRAANFRRVITDSRKFVPIFYQKYFDIYDLTNSDYEFYYNRPFEGGTNLCYANGKLISDEIFAENGFIYLIDQVVEPLRNAYQILESGNSTGSYTKYLDLVNNFPDLRYNERATLSQEGARLGLQVDSLFDLTYPALTFNIYNEKTQPPLGVSGLPGNVTIRYHHGLMAPANNALDALVDNYLAIPNGWGSLENTPRHIQKIIVNTHMSFNPVYPTDLESGFYNGEADLITIDQDNVIHREFGSNCTFIGLNEAIVPRAFSSVSGAVYLRQGFSKIMYAIEEANLLPLLKRSNKNYMFFVESDMNTSTDSSLIYDPFLKRFYAYQIFKETSEFIQFRLNKNELIKLFINHIAVDNPKGIAKREFIPNLAGNYFIINNETGEVSGTNPTTAGFNGTELAPEFPRVIYEADNGRTFEINNWFSFGSPSLYLRISTQFPEFHSLLIKAGLANVQEFRYNFISDSEIYTVFAPTSEAINGSGLNSLSGQELKQALRFHFVRGNHIFTDGNKSAGYYETARIDEKSTSFSTLFSKLYIDPGIDVIRFKKKDGQIYETIHESEVTNMLTGLTVSSTAPNEVFPSIFNNAVIHEIDKVLIFEELDTQ